MASEALNWAIANGLGQAEFDARIFNAVRDAQAAGTSNAMLRIEMDRLGISPEDVARATGVKTQDVAAKYTTAVPTTEAELIANAAADAELAARTARDKTASQSLITSRNLDATTSAGLLSAAQKVTADAAQAELVRKQNEAAELLARNNAAYAEQQRLNNLAYAEQQRLNNLKNQQQIATNQKAYEAYLANQAKLAAQQAGTGTPVGTGPFAGATQGFEQNFRNYTSIPIGAQYNPNVVGGTGSPYAQVMGQMQPVGNPYANVVAGQAMGGYNPALYDQIAAANVARTAAANAGVTLADYYGGGGDGGDSGSSGDGNTGGGPGTGADGDAAFSKGGMVRTLLGPDPQGPDDGMGYLDKGEYVIKKSSVNKYGRGLLDMINEGKVPAKKMKSLLG